MNSITSWWIKCLQDNTWWPKTRNNLVHKDTFMKQKEKESIYIQLLLL